MTRVLALAALLLPFFSAPRARADDPVVQLPYVLRDDFGSNWDVQFDGSIGDGGNDLYDGGGRLFVNNAAQYQSPNGQATFDAARNELSLPPMQVGGVVVSRKVAGLTALGAIRFTEVVENPGNAPAKVQLRCYFNMGSSVQQAIPLVDPKRPARPPCGHAITDGNNSVAMIGAARNAKAPPRFGFRQNDDNVDILYDLDVPPKQTVAIVHVQLRRRTVGESADAWQDVRDQDLLRDIPKPLRRRVVNFPNGDDLIGDLEILRGDALDVVELRGGDAYRGTLKIERYKLQAPYGQVTLPAEKVIAVLNVGAFRPSQLVVTTEGDVFAGRLDVTTVKLQMTGGQIVNIPIGQVTRVGHRRRPGEPEDWNFENKSVAHLRGGERLRVHRPTADFNLATPSGPIRLPPSVVSSIEFQNEQTNVPEVRLTDGSRISALLGASTFDASLPGLGPDQRLRLPAAAMVRFTFTPEPEIDPLGPTMTLANGDALVGTIGGTLSLETPFDTLHVEGPQVKALAHSKGGAGGGGDHDVRITLWDDSTISGRLVESHLTCLLKCGVGVRLPVALIDRYTQPMPQPSPPVVERIRRVAKDLDSESWGVRDRAQSEILSIGPAAMSILRQLQPTAPSEAAQRIEVIIVRLTEQVNAENKVASPNVAGAPGDAPILNPGMLLLDR